MDAILSFEQFPMATVIVTVIALSLFTVWFFRRIGYGGAHQAKPTSGLPSPPEIPGLPVIGNLLQLKEKKPHKTFARWAEKYGPVYLIKTGSTRLVILNSSDVAKEAMVTRFASISTRKLSNAIKILTDDKKIVAMADYGEFHKTVKRHLLTSTLGPNAQKRQHSLRDILIESVSKQLHACLDEDPLRAVNFRKIFQSELFRLSMKQALGSDVESVFVEELGITLSKDDMLQILVINPMKGAIEVDWRDFFPYLRWIPNRSFEKNLQQMFSERQAVMSALIREQKKQISGGEEVNCYLDYLSSEAKTLSEQHILMLVWEAIIESSDTTLVTTEWAMYELAKDPEKQDRLYREIQNVCGNQKITEEKLSELPYLSAVFHETLRKYSPAPVVPLRFVHEDTQLGGYSIPAGTEIAINIYGCNMDKKVWDDPEDWKPERFLDDKYDAMDMHKTMAFGAGKRVCAGSLQAMLISCTTIGRLVQEFEWRLKEGEEGNIDTLGLTTHKLHPMQAILRART